MYYSVYAQTQTSVTKREYHKIMENILLEHKEINVDRRRYKQIYFQQRDFDWKSAMAQENADVYSVVLDENSKELFLEKSSKRNGMIYMKNTHIDKSEYLQLEQGNYQWTKDCGDPLLEELYLQLAYNQQILSDVYQYDDQIIWQESRAEAMILNISNRKVKGSLLDTSLFSSSADILNQIIVNVRKYMTIPAFLKNTGGLNEYQYSMLPAL